MRNTIITLLLLLSNFSTAFSQVDTTDFRDSSNYKLAIDFYKSQIKKNPTNFHNYYQVACYYSLIQSTDSAFKHLEKSIELGAKGENILTDTDFNSLHQHDNWNNILNLIKGQYLSKNPDITKPDLGFELWLMWVEDQRWRTLFKNYKLKEKPKQISMDPHYARVDRLNEIIKKSGWPKYSEVGVKAGDAVFYVFQHHIHKEMKKKLPIFIETAKQGEADLGKVAMMIDRLISFKENVQIYGSQAYAKGRLGDDYKDVTFKLYPIADEENVRRRREALGMPDFDKNCERLRVKYVEIEDREDYKPIPIKKKWIRKGYLLVE